MRITPRVQYFTADGQGTGDNNLAVDGSVTPVVFKAQIPTGFSKFHVERCIFTLRDTGTFLPEKFATLTALTNGCGITYETGDQSIDLLGGHPIKMNCHFARVAFDSTTTGTAVQVLASRWTFWKWGDGPIELENSEFLELTVNDNLSTIEEFCVVAEGWIT